jgi:1-acyl-sn-glycerol-3-phosphate acyltransferase
MVRHPIFRYSALLLTLVYASGALADVTRPVTVEERRAELVALEAEVAELKPKADSTLAKLRQLEPAFEEANRRIHAVKLDDASRKALVEQGLAGLSAEQRAPFEEAAPAFTAMGAALTEHFAAYDQLNVVEMRSIVGGYLMRTLTRAQFVDPHLSDKERTKVQAALAEVARADEKMRNALTDAETKAWNRVTALDGVWEAATAADAVIDPLMAKHGLTPGVPWGAKLRKLGETVAYYARGVKAVAGTVPAIARVTAYLFNPFRKKGDPEKLTKLLRGLGKSYSWASGMKIEVSGREKVPTDTSIVYAMSHRSGLEDGVTMASVIPTDYAFMAAAGVFPGFISKQLAKQPSMILVGGKDPKTQEKVDAVKASVAALQDGLDLALFPEGTTPTRHQETHPLRHGIDVITAQMGARPVAVVAVAMDDPSQDFNDRLKRQSLHGASKIQVTFSDPIDPLKMKSVPGATSQLMLDVVRAFYHKHMLWRAAPAQELGTVPAAVPAPAN